MGPVDHARGRAARRAAEEVEDVEGAAPLSIFLDDGYARRLGVAMGSFTVGQRLKGRVGSAKFPRFAPFDAEAFHPAFTMAENIFFGPVKLERRDSWAPFRDRMHGTVIPNARKLQDWARENGIEVLHARIACQKTDGRDRSLSQKKPGFNYLLLPKDEHESQIVDELAPVGDEIVVTKTTDSALTGTNLRLMLHNMGIERVIVAGIFTDQCVSSTVRSLADESFEVVVIEDCCAAATQELHENELRIINMIYCHVMSLAEVQGLERKA